MKQIVAFSCFVLLSCGNLVRAEEPSFCSNQIMAHPIPNGYTWTLASRLGKILLLAEKEYGPRDKQWTLLGVEFTDGDQPKIWYPFGKDKKNIIIQITRKAANDSKEMALQLAHEVFHALSPTGSKKSNYLEEGLATWFSIKAMRELGISVSQDYIATEKYRDAYDLIDELYKQQPDASQRVRELRQSGELFNEIDMQIMKTFFPAVKADLARQLIREF